MSMTALAAPRKVTWAGTQYEIKVTRAESAGIVGIFTGLVPPGEGPPVHIHHNEDEVINVIEGEYEFWLDGETSRAAPGSSIFLPRGVPHTFRVISGTPGLALGVVTPGGFEEFFPAMAESDLRIPQDMPEIMRIAGRFGIEFLGPAPWKD